MIYTKKLIAAISAIAILNAQMPMAAYAAATDYIASQENATIDDLYHAINNGDIIGVQNFTAKTRGMLFQSGLGSNYKVNFNFTDNNGDTPLIRAARGGRDNIVDYLTSQGANVNLVNNNGETAVMAAASRGHYTTVQILAAKGAPIPAGVVQNMTNVEQSRVAASSVAGSGNTMMLVGIGGAVILGGAAVGVALAGGGGGGTSGGGGGAPIIPGLTISCHPGSVSDHSPDNCVPGDFVTAESAAMEGNAAMQEQFALARGYDGSIYNRAVDGTLLDELPDGHVKVAVVDTGIDLTHDDLDSNIILNLSVTCNNSGCVSGGSDTFGHGTEVAGIIAAERTDTGVGMHGVAPQAHLMSIGFADSGGSLTGGDIPGIKYAVDNGAQVLNGSYGKVYFDATVGAIIERPIVNAIDSFADIHVADSPAQLRAELVQSIGGATYLSDFQNLVTHHSIMVFAAGNDSMNQVGVLAGLPLYFQGASAPVGVTQPNYDTVNVEHYDWSHNFVVAVALNAAGNAIASYSNECGVAKEWCLAAPGDITKSTANGGGYNSNIQGTSFAAPNVTGAIAVMLGAFPQLTPEQALQIIFDTADDLGASGVDAVYGHGLVDLKKATSPSDGGWTLSVHSLHQAASFAFNSSALNLSPAFGSGISGQGLSVIFLDKYNKDYAIPLEALSAPLQKREDNATKLSRFGYGIFSNRYDISDNSHVSYSMAADNNDLIPASGFAEDKDSGSKLGNASYITTLGDKKENISLNFNYKTSVADIFGFAGLSDSGDADLSATGVYKNPYLNFSHDAKSSIVNYNRNNAGFTAGAYQGTQRDDNAYEFDNSDTGIKGAFVQYSHKNDYGLISLTGGVNIESNTLLGSEASGAFNLAGNSATYYSSLGAKYDFNDHLSFLGNYNLGVTHAQAGASSLFTSVGNIVTDSFSLGAEYTGIRTNDDRLGFAVSQPLRVRNAQASLSLPYDVDTDGSIIYRNNKVSLAATAREVDMETYYGLELSDKSKLALSGVYAINPDNNEQNPNEGLLLLKYSQELN